MYDINNYNCVPMTIEDFKTKKILNKIIDIQTKNRCISFSLGFKNEETFEKFRKEYEDIISEFINNNKRKEILFNYEGKDVEISFSYSSNPNMNGELYFMKSIGYFVQA